MGQEEVKKPSTAEGWAIKLSKIVKVFHETHGLDRFPINVEAVALDYSKNVFPDEPITLVEGNSFGKNFEGALIPNPICPGEWGIFYNTNIKSTGRRNFTLGHELGHYLLHRHRSRESIFCTKSDMWTWNSSYGKMESEANTFASYLLMPLDDFRGQTNRIERPTIKSFEIIRKRYAVSLTAAILKWLDITKKRAMIVISIDGYIDWSRSSGPLMKSGVFFKARQITVLLPEGSLAAGKRNIPSPENGEMLSAGVWAENEEVFESVVFSEYHGMAISLLVYPDHGPGGGKWAYPDSDDPESIDTLDEIRRS